MAARPPAADERQAQLTVVIQNAFAPMLAKMEGQLAQCNISINSVISRLDGLEAIIGKGGAGAAKKTTKASGGKKPAKKAGEPPKLTNSLLYFRWACSTDEETRNRFLPAETVDALRDHEALKKKDDQKDPEGWWSALANQAWRSHLSDDDKSEVKGLYQAYKENGAGGEEQLEADPAADE